MSGQADTVKTADGQTRKVTEVAVGGVVPAGGQVLLAPAPAGKPYEGYWEFPGGKLEPGESVEAALARELHEELGLDIVRSEHWHTLEHDYPHAYVRLYFRKITEWRGDPVGREGQAFSWQTAPVSVGPLLPATIPVVDWLAEESRAS